MTRRASPCTPTASSRCGAPRASWPTSRRCSSSSRCPAPWASATPAGPPTAAPATRTPTPTASRTWRSFTTASSRTTWRSRNELRAQGHSFASDNRLRDLRAPHRAPRRRRPVHGEGRPRRRLARRGHVRPGRHLRPLPRRGRGRQEPQPAGGRPGPGRELRGLGHARAARAHPRLRVPRGGRPGGAEEGLGAHPRPAGRRGEALGPPRGLDADDGREERPQALHAQGDLRAAHGHRGHHPRPVAGRGGRRPPGRLPALGRAGAGAGEGHRAGLRHQLARGPGGQVGHRVAGAHPRRGRARQRVPLPRPHRQQQDAGHRGEPVGRDGRHAGGPARGQEARRPHRLGVQRARQQHPARVGLHHLHARRPRDWGGVDQVLHHAAHRDDPPGAEAGPHEGHAVGGAGARAPGPPARAAQAGRGGAGAGAGHQGHVARVQHGAGRALPGPRARSSRWRWRGRSSSRRSRISTPRATRRAR